MSDKVGYLVELEEDTGSLRIHFELEGDAQ